MKVGLGPGHIMLDGTQPPPKKGGTALNFRPMSIVAKRLDGSRCHLVRKASAQATLCWTETQLLPHRKEHNTPPLFDPYLLWPNGRPSQQPMSFCSKPAKISEAYI